MLTTLRQALDNRRSEPAPYDAARFDGRGIVICAGGERYFTCAWVLIHVLRKVHGCTLPIQLWHLSRGEMSEEMRLLLVDEGIEVVDAETVVARHPASLKGGWPLKPYAIAQSRFREVLYLDADTVPLVDPAIAFTWDAYRDTGLLLWPDIVDLRASNPVWERLGLTPVDAVSVDSGLLVVDKARAFGVLDIVTLMNQHTDALYDVLYGDKDTFLLAARFLGHPFGMIAARPFRFDWDLVQRDPAGEPFVHHRTGSKWTLHRQNRPMSDAALMPACEDALAELRRRWSGLVFHPPARSERAQAEEARLIAVRSFRYHTGPANSRTLELLPAARIGQGAAVETNWVVIEQDDALVLKLSAGRRDYVTLTKMPDGSWRGGSDAPGSDMRLDELGPGGEAPAADAPLPRSAAALVAALLQPSLFATGFDAARADALAAALTLINDSHDDVPEELARQTARLAPPAPWRTRLETLATTLAPARDTRAAAVTRVDMVSHALKPELYERK